MSNPHVPLFAVATVNDDFLPETTDPDFSFNYVDISSISDFLPETTDPDFSFNYVDISSISDFHVSDTLARFTFREAPSRARRLAQPGDIALSTVRTYLRAIAPITEHHADSVFSTGFAIIRPKPSVLNSSFLQYVALSTDFIDSIVSHSNGVSYPAINATDVMRFRIPLPPLESQKRIADYLDEETSRIDNTVRTMDELIEEMGARRERLIGEVTKKGIEKFNSSNGYYISGIDSRLSPLWSSLSVQNGFPFKSESFSNSGEIPLIRIRDVMGGRFETFISEDSKPPSEFMINDGDLVIGMDGDFNHIIWSRGEAAVNQRVCIIKTDNDTDIRFINYAISDPLKRINDLMFYTTVKHLSQDDIYSIRILLPPLEEQIRTADYLDKETEKIDGIVSTAKELRSELLSRRSAIITEVVMGKKKI